MEAMIRHQQGSAACGHSTVVVISDRPDVQGLKRAHALGIESICIPLPSIEDPNNRRLAHEKQIQEILNERDVELVLLSGYMRLLTPWLIERWAPNLLNIHPSLLPAFPGAHAHRDVLASNVHVTGCTVHRVDEGMDTGEILGQSRVPVFPDDNQTSLSQRVKITEHALYPKIVDHLVTMTQPGEN